MPIDRTPCPSPDCDAAFADQDLLASHFSRAHPGDRLVLAPSTSGDLEARGKPELRCPICAKPYKTKGYLNRHLSNEHGSHPLTNTAPSSTDEPASDPLTRSLTRAIDRVVASRRSTREEGEDLGEVVGYALIVEISPGVSVTLRVDGPMAFSLVCEAAERYGIPYTTTQP